MKVRRSQIFNSSQLLQSTKQYYFLINKNNLLQLGTYFARSNESWSLRQLPNFPSTPELIGLIYLRTN